MRNYKQAKHMVYVLENHSKLDLEEPDDSVDESASMLEKKMWEEEVKRYIVNKELLDENMAKLYMLLWGQCTDTMQAELRSILVLCTDVESLLVIKITFLFHFCLTIKYNLN